jgi:rSAM/selenodomain-associated transferase 2
VSPRLSIIVPTLDEAQSLAATLSRLSAMRSRGVEVIVADGGSGDGTRAIAAGHADRVLEAPRGRASQLNAGANAATGTVLLFLHADTHLPDGADRLVLEGLATSGCAWGRFDVRIEGNSPLLAVVAAFMNLRSRLTGIATGDQAIFVKRDAFEDIGRFPPIALMEDIAITASLKRISRPLCIRRRATTSGRRWEKRGTWATILLMWRLRMAYFFGADPAALAKRYDAASRHG